MKYKIEHALGTFTVDEEGVPTTGKATKEAPPEVTLKFLGSIKDYSPEAFSKANRKITSKDTKEAFTPDVVLVQKIGTLKDMKDAEKTMLPHLREAVGFTHPEKSRNADAEQLVKLAQENKPEDLGIKITGIQHAAKALQGLIEGQKQLTKHIGKQLQEIMPNVVAIAGHDITMQLLAHAGSLQRLSRLPASTIQVLGAEKAFFRHLTTGAKTPKHGILFYHPLVQATKKQFKGKAARAIAEKIAIAAKVDQFKGKYIGDKLKKEVEAKWPK